MTESGKMLKLRVEEKCVVIAVLSIMLIIELLKLLTSQEELSGTFSKEYGEITITHTMPVEGLASKW
jgi:hypothetical protein